MHSVAPICPWVLGIAHRNPHRIVTLDATWSSVVNQGDRTTPSKAWRTWQQYKVVWQLFHWKTQNRVWYNKMNDQRLGFRPGQSVHRVHVFLQKNGSFYTIHCTYGNRSFVSSLPISAPNGLDDRAPNLMTNYVQSVLITLYRLIPVSIAHAKNAHS